MYEYNEASSGHFANRLFDNFYAHEALASKIKTESNGRQTVKA